MFVCGKQFIIVLHILKEQFLEKTNIMDSVYCINPDQPVQSSLANPDQHIPSQGDSGREK